MAILDVFGTETLGTIDDFGPSRFVDSTSKIRMKLFFHSKPKRSLTVSVTFHRFRLLSEVEIDFTGPGARELVRGTVESLTSFVSTSPARIGWAYPSESVSGAAFVFAVALASFAVPLSSYATVRTAIPYVCLLLIAIWYAGLGKAVTPYSVIDTSVNERRGKMWGWLGKTLLGFLLVGVVLATLKDKIFAALG